jgi:phage-related protein
MAVANTFTFGSISSAAYGVVLEGPGEYTAPVRATKMINVPGRNGALVIDLGYYENVDAEYHCVIQADTQSAFESAVADFRNAIVGQIGYQRLEDTYHAGEYREAIYVGGFDEEADFHGRSAIFTLKFSCKPQRFVADGQTEITIASGGTTVNNPTPFDAYPLLEVEGYGAISIGSYDVNLSDTVLGYAQITNAESRTGLTNQTGFPTNLVNNSDKVTISGASFNMVFSSTKALKSAEATSITGFSNATANIGCSENTASMTLSLGNISISVPSTSYIMSGNVVLTFTAEDDTAATVTIGVRLKYDRNAVAPGVDFVTADVTGQSASGFASSAQEGDVLIYIPAIMASSTASALGHPTYIDCSIGEVYRLIADHPISLNSVSNLGTDLPKLAPGNTLVSYSGNITELKVIPRWWQL